MGSATPALTPPKRSGVMRAPRKEGDESHGPDGNAERDVEPPKVTNRFQPVVALGRVGASGNNGAKTGTAPSQEGGIGFFPPVVHKGQERTMTRKLGGAGLALGQVRLNRLLHRRRDFAVAVKGNFANDFGTVHTNDSKLALIF